MKYDFLIFDLDGTLVDSKDDLAKASNDLRAYYNLEPLDLETIISFVGNGLKVLADNILPQEYSQKEETLEKFIEFYDRCLTDTTKPYKGIIDLLESFDKSVKKAVLSNKSQDFTRRILDVLGLSRHFIEIWGGDNESGVKKPDPKVIYALIDKTQSKIENTIIIGDGINDIGVAKAAGIASIGILYGFTPAETIVELKPNYLAKSPAEIKKILK
ncbi:MAG: HAD-IA family hydrolase [Elusimicrobiota bacterium]|jgi:phosphoglycolate phosphatase|nr:HAD-IA family hydrolase [Elusimicrobiota bacterium]